MLFLNGEFQEIVDGVKNKNRINVSNSINQFKINDRIFDSLNFELMETASSKFLTMFSFLNYLLIYILYNQHKDENIFYVTPNKIIVNNFQIYSIYELEFMKKVISREMQFITKESLFDLKKKFILEIKNKQCLDENSIKFSNLRRKIKQITTRDMLSLIESF